MSDGRAAILGRVRRAIAARRSSGSVAVRPGHYIRPQRARGSAADLIDRFRKMAQFAGASISTVPDEAKIPLEVARYLSDQEFGESFVLSPSVRIQRLPWKAGPHLPPFGSDDRVAVTDVVAGVAETGTLLVRSGPESPNGLHLLPEAHIAIIDGSAIVGSYEEALDMLAQDGTWPRAATFITGPSRTADIEKTPQIGVHGPRQLHIILVHG